jgi:hypothetical protein
VDVLLFTTSVGAAVGLAGSTFSVGLRAKSHGETSGSTPFDVVARGGDEE